MSKVVTTVLNVERVEECPEKVHYHGTFSINGEFIGKDGEPIKLDLTFTIDISFYAVCGRLIYVALSRLNASPDEDAWTSLIGDLKEWKERGQRSRSDKRMLSKHDEGYSTTQLTVLKLFSEHYYATVTPASNAIRQGEFKFFHNTCGDWLVKAIYDEFQG